jgi:hypothetical protein
MRRYNLIISIRILSQNDSLILIQIIINNNTTRDINYY